MVKSKLFCRLLPIPQNIPSLEKKKKCNSDCKLRSTFFFLNVVLGNKNRLTFQSCKADLYSGVQLNDFGVERPGATVAGILQYKAMVRAV